MWHDADVTLSYSQVCYIHGYLLYVSVSYFGPYGGVELMVSAVEEMSEKGALLTCFEASP